MDGLSAEMFANPLVRIMGFAEDRVRIERACIHIFGRPLSPEELAELIAAKVPCRLVMMLRPMNRHSVGLGQSRRGEV